MYPYVLFYPPTTRSVKLKEAERGLWEEQQVQSSICSGWWWGRMVRMSASRVSSQGVGVAWFSGIFLFQSIVKEVEGDGEMMIETEL